MSVIIETKNLTRSFGEGETLVKALDDVTMTIEQGEFTALVGPSGSGKSTLLHLMGGLDEPTSGHILLDGTNISDMSETQLSRFRRDHIGFIFQAYNLIPVLNVTENIEYIMLLQGVDMEIRREKTSAILKKVGLAGKEHRLPSQLSGGQQQRVAVARAMVSEPRIILADEPTANLDSKTGSDLIELMRELNQEQGKTFVFSTHDLKIMEQADRLVHLQDGAIDYDEVKITK